MKAETAVKTKLVKTENRVPAFVMPLVKTLIFTVDALLAATSFMIAFIWREGDAIFSPTAWAWSKEFVPYAGVLFFIVPVRLAMLVYQRVFRLQGAFSYINEIIFKSSHSDQLAM